MDKKTKLTEQQQAIADKLKEAWDWSAFADQPLAQSFVEIIVLIMDGLYNLNPPPVLEERCSVMWDTLAKLLVDEHKRILAEAVGDMDTANRLIDGNRHEVLTAILQRIIDVDGSPHAGLHVTANVTDILEADGGA